MAFDHERYSAIGHTGMPFWNPVSPLVLARWIERLPLDQSSAVLDVGCGRAELLVRLVRRFSCRSIGMDRSQLAIATAAEAKVSSSLRDRIELRCEPFDPSNLLVSGLDLAVCVGSTHAIGTYVEALETLSRMVRPGGLLLIGEGYWRKDPDPEYLAFLGTNRSDLRSHEENRSVAESLSLNVVDDHESTEEEWSHYEDTYASNILRFVDDHPDDPQAPAMRTKIEAWRDAYLRWGRKNLGFGLYLLRVPS